jgi:ribonuclease PH
LDSNADVDMNVIMNEKGNFIELQATAEKRSFNDGELAQMLSLARTSVANLIQTIKTVKA